jgi:hypothetical protein
MALENGLVLKDNFETGHIGPFTENEVRIVTEKWMPELPKNGISGDPPKHRRKKGRAISNSSRIFSSGESSGNRPIDPTIGKAEQTTT